MGPGGLAYDPGTRPATGPAAQTAGGWHEPPLIDGGGGLARGGYAVIAVAWDQTTCQVSSWSR
jgi:hypothetical protein